MPTITIPPATFEIPDGLDRFGRLYVAGQVAASSVLHVFGDEDLTAGTKQIATDEILGGLAMGLAMMLTADTRHKTPQDVRKAAEQWGKAIAGYAKGIKEGNDQIGTTLLNAMKLQQAEITLD